MSPNKDVPLHKKRWRDQVPKEKNLMRKCQRVLAEMRRYQDSSLDNVAKAHGMTADVVIRTTNAFHKEHGRWRANEDDNLSRCWEFYENGEAKTIYVNNLADTRLIAKYHNAVKKFLHTGDATYLKPFEGLQIMDEDGVYHIFETDPDKVRSILARIEDFETYEVYNV
jgi:hypothetical protein